MGTMSINKRGELLAANTNAYTILGFDQSRKDLIGMLISSVMAMPVGVVFFSPPASPLLYTLYYLFFVFVRYLFW